MARDSLAGGLGCSALTCLPPARLDDRPYRPTPCVHQLVEQRLTDVRKTAVVERARKELPGLKADIS